MEQPINERSVTAKYRGEEYRLVFTAGIDLDFTEEYKLQSIFDIFEIKGSNRLLAVLDLVKRMSAKAGRAITFDPDMSTAEFLALQSDAIRAIERGFAREVDPGEIDEGLLELEKKKEDPQGRISWFWRVLDFIFPSRTRTTRRRG